MTKEIIKELLSFGAYFRYSSDELQDDKSIEDQQAECFEYIEKLGGYISDDHIFFDEGQSGATQFRKGYGKLLKAIENREFDILIAESLDRLSRNQGDLSKLYELCQFHGIKIVTLSEGDNIDELYVSVKGMQSAFFLKDLSYKTKRGLRGRVRDGKNPGSCPYGFRPSMEIDPVTKKKVTGVLIKDERECENIENIFIWYEQGMGLRNIANRLNDIGEPGPSGGLWRVGSVRTILANETYIGRRIWGRYSNMKNPKTGKTVKRKNPESEWHIYEDENLRVIGDNLWAAVQARRAEISDKAHNRCARNKLTGMRRSKYALSGKLFCSECGASYTVGSKNRYNCAEYKHGRCKNGKSIRRHVLENHVLDILLEKMLEPERVKRFTEACRSHAERIRKRNDEKETLARRELQKIEKNLASYMNAIEQGIDAASIKSKIMDLEKQKKTLLAALQPRHPLFVPDDKLIDRYRDILKEFAENLDDETIRQRAMNILRPLVDKIVLHPMKGGLRAEIYGTLENLLSVGTDSDGHFFYDPESDIARRTVGRHPISDSMVMVIELPHWQHMRRK